MLITCLLAAFFVWFSPFSFLFRWKRVNVCACLLSPWDMFTSYCQFFLYNVLNCHSKTVSMPIRYFLFLKKLYAYILLLYAKSVFFGPLFFHIRKYSALSLIINWLVFFDDFYLYAHFNVKINACHILLVFFLFQFLSHLEMKNKKKKNRKRRNGQSQRFSVVFIERMCNNVANSCLIARKYIDFLICFVFYHIFCSNYCFIFYRIIVPFLFHL